MDNSNELVSLRSEISSQVSKWFKKKIHIDERLLQILEYAPSCEDGWMDSADIFSATMVHLPSISNVLVRAGVKPESVERAATKLNKLATFNRSIVVRPDIERTLDFAFPYFVEPSLRYSRVRKKGSISVSDFITAILEPDEDYGVSELSADILSAASLQENYWDKDNSKFMADLVNRVHFLDEIDTSIGDQQFVIYWDGTHYKVGAFGTSGIYQLSNEPLKDGSLWIARGNILQPIKRFTDEAFEKLEFLINRDSKENEFQTFFEENTEFLLALGGGKYSNVHPQIVLHEDDGGQLIPDFLLEKVNDHFCDICDLKLSTQLLAKRKRHRPGFRAVIYEAISQLEFYRNWFDDKQHRDEFYSRTGLNAYRPRVVLIVGRKLDYYTDIQRIQNESLLPEHVELITYDEIIERAKMYRKLAQ